MDVSLSEPRELVMGREAWRAAIHGVAKSRTWLSDWTELNWTEWSIGFPYFLQFKKREKENAEEKIVIKVYFSEFKKDASL